MKAMKKDIQDLLERVLEGMGLEESVSPQVTVPENPEHGDYSTNIAMLLSKQLKKSPVKIAEDLKNAIVKDQTISDAGIIDRVEVAGPGFVNLYLSEASLINQVSEVLKKQDTYGSVTKHASPIGGPTTAKPKIEGKKDDKTTAKTTTDITTREQVKIGKKPAKISRYIAAKGKVARQKAAGSMSSGQKIIPELPKNTQSPERSRLWRESRRITIEFAQPNPFKEIHIGHVRNIALGESYSRLAEAAGKTVRRVNYEGDVGMHVAKSLWGLERLDKDGVDINGIGLDVRGKAALLGRAYAVGSKAFEGDTSVTDDITNLNKKIYAMDESIVAQWRRGRQWSLDYFDTVYTKLGTHFDRYYFESEAAPVGIALVEKHIADKIFEKSDGAVIYRGEKIGLHTRVFITREHHATYEAKDLALAPLKYSEWPYDLSIIMTGNEQSEYFKVMLAALFEINPDLASKTRHMPFGMVRLTTGKMSSRTGDVITADWLIEEAKKRIYIILDSNKTNYSKKEKDEIAQKAAIAAIKYSMLRVNATSDIAFDLVASVSFEGDSGPYMQYTYARCKSVLRKAQESSVISDQLSAKILTDNGLLNTEERILMRSIAEFPDVVADAAQNFSPNTIATYLFHLAQQFNLFYAKHQIIGNDTRLALTAATAQVIKNGLYLLGIETMEQM
jgi:arginyl-tRNA synthetase